MIEKLRKQSTSNILRGLLCAFSLAFLIGAILAPDRGEMFSGFWRIITKPSLLTKDYFFAELGSVSGSLLNAALVGAAMCAMMFLPGATVAGGTVAAYMLSVGFCSFGLNLLNILPIYLGTWVYAKLKKQPFAKNINFAMFATALSPLISEVLFRYPSATETHGVTLLGVVLALVIGVVVGVCMPSLCAHAQSFHKGYDLYNAGPAAGFLCFAIFTIMYKAIGLQAPAIEAILGESHAAFCNTFAIICFVLCIAFGLILGGAKNYVNLMLDPGHKVDFAAKHGVGATVINFGVYGLFILAYYNAVGAKFTGPTFGVIWCMLAFCAAGATPLNVLPILLGYVVSAFTFGATAINAQGIIVGACYASGLAPITGHYGPIAGLVGGILHYCMVTSVPAIHGGFNLYNGGFTAGLVAFVLVPVLECFFKTFEQKKTAKKG